MQNSRPGVRAGARSFLGQMTCHTRYFGLMWLTSATLDLQVRLFENQKLATGEHHGDSNWHRRRRTLSWSSGH